MNAMDFLYASHYSAIIKMNKNDIVHPLEMWHLEPTH